MNVLTLYWSPHDRKGLLVTWQWQSLLGSSDPTSMYAYQVAARVSYYTLSKEVQGLHLLWLGWLTVLSRVCSHYCKFLHRTRLFLFRLFH